ncbi:DUF6541 family protein [Sinomonas cellulolyticus]|uniref:Uncharacterized protein n=1 Tax=Sinomonas cellulolyticus TaxID=2801916 RepID=A0ABS1K058_9MICC|nr:MULTISPECIES: DUF6541 family protein [Sinomonas]MBL0704905.1 hypothetical protein [Sinomonas cellulolyticus]
MAVAVMFVPGVIVGLAARLRGLQLVAFAAPISVSVASLAALVAPWIGLTWSAIPIALATIVAVLACRLVARKLPLHRAPTGSLEGGLWGRWASGGAALALAAVLIGRRLLYVFGNPESISQTFDNVFHLNAVRYIVDTGNASSIFVSTLTGGGFYPAAWHGIVAIVAGFGSEVTVATNVVNLVIGCLVWPLSIMALTASVMGRRPSVLWLAAVFSTGFGAFPILLLDFGVLYPNFLGTALLPAAIALLVRAVGIGAESEPRRRMAGLLLVMSVPGLALAHPNSLMTLLAVSVPIFLVVWARWWRRRGGLTRGWFLPIGVLLGGLIAVAAAWYLIRPPMSAATWAPVETVGQAVGEVLALSGIGRPPTWLPAILAIAGIVWVARTARHRWFLGVYAVIGTLFVVVAGVPFGNFRTALTGVYYNDPPRLAALLPVVGIPLAVAGGVWIWDRSMFLVRKYWVRNHHASSDILVPVLAVVAIVLSVAAVQTGSIRDAAKTAAVSYALTPTAPLVSTDEMALLRRLAKDTPPNSLLVGNPWNGSSLAYAIADRRVVQAHILSEIPSGLPTVYEHLNEAKSDPTVCKAVRSLHITYVLDFGHQEVHGGDHGVRGLDHLVQAGVAQLVDQQGTAKLLRITACGDQG